MLQGMIVWKAAPSLIPGAFSSAPEVRKLIPSIPFLELMGSAGRPGAKTSPNASTPPNTSTLIPAGSKKKATHGPLKRAAKSSKAKSRFRRRYHEDIFDTCSGSEDDDVDDVEDDDFDVEDSASDGLEMKIFQDMERWLSADKMKGVAGLVQISPDGALRGVRPPAAVIVESYADLPPHPLLLFASVLAPDPSLKSYLCRKVDVEPEVEIQSQNRELKIMTREAAAAAPPPTDQPDYFRPYAQPTRGMSVAITSERRSSILGMPFWRDRQMSCSVARASDVLDAGEEDLAQLILCPKYYVMDL